MWLRLGDSGLFGERVRRILDSEDQILLSPMVLLEMQMLYEGGRLKRSASEIAADLTAFIGARVCTYPFGLVVEQALLENWTTDPGDRLITAHARARRATLITRDPQILANYDLGVW